MFTLPLPCPKFQEHRRQALQALLPRPAQKYLKKNQQTNLQRKIQIQPTKNHRTEKTRGMINQQVTRRQDLHQLEMVLLVRLPRLHPPRQARRLVNPHQAEPLYAIPHLDSHHQVEHRPQLPPPNRDSLLLDPHQVLAVTGSHTHQVDQMTQKLKVQPHLISAPHLLIHQEGAHRDHRRRHLLLPPLLQRKRHWER